MGNISEGSSPLETVTIDDVRRAHAAIHGLVHHTPLFTSATLSAMTGTRLTLKAESLQKTGSFKVRGTIFAAKSLSPEERKRGLIAITAGNHGAALAYGAGLAGTPATIVMPAGAVQAKIAAVRGYGGEVVLVDPSHLIESMEEIQRKQDSIYVNPIGSLWMIAGAGTAALEILDDIAEVPELVVVPVGGGGLIAGIATTIKALSPSTRVVGVEPETADVVHQSLAAGKPVRIDYPTSIADGLNTPFAAPLSFEIIQRCVDEMVTVSDAEVVCAMRLILERMKLVVEPAGAAAVAALLARKVPDAGGRRVVAFLSGGNVDLRRLQQMLA